MPEDATEQDAAKVKRPYQRQKSKKQLTVRIDEDLLKVALAQADFAQLRITDAIEEGLWLWVQQKRVPGVALRGRFLWSVIPLDLQKLLESAIDYLYWPRRSAVEEVFRKYMRDAFTANREDPEYLQRLKKLGAMSYTNEEEEQTRSVS